MLQVILLQVCATLIVAGIAAVVSGLHGALSALLGGVCCFLPNGLFALRLYIDSKKPVPPNPMSFFLGEFIKVAAIILLAVGVVKSYELLVWPAFLGGFIVVLKSYLILLFRH